MWEAALDAAWGEPDAPREVYWPLNGLRCLGARMVPTDAGSLRIVCGDEVPVAEFRADCRTYLAAHLAALRRVLRAAAEETLMAVPVRELQPA